MKEVMQRNEALEVQSIAQQKQAEQQQAQFAAQLADKQQALEALRWRRATGVRRSEQNGALNEKVVALTAEVAGGEESRTAQGAELEKMKAALAAAAAETAGVRAEMGEKEKILAETTEEHVGAARASEA